MLVFYYLTKRQFCTLIFRKEILPMISIDIDGGLFSPHPQTMIAALSNTREFCIIRM